jgi:hypothetical protein
VSHGKSNGLFNEIFCEFQFGRQQQTCLSAMILKQLTIDSFMLTKTPGIIIDNDANGAFDRVSNGLALVALHSLGFARSITCMLVLTWSNRKCYIKTGFGISDQSTQSKQNGGLGQGSTAASDTWCVIHGVLMHTIATFFIKIVLVSVSKIYHKRIGEGFIDDAGIAVSAQSSTEITSSRRKRFTTDEGAIFTKMHKMIQLFLELHVLASQSFVVGMEAVQLYLLQTHDSHPVVTFTYPSSGEVRYIECKDPNEAHRALGWMMNTHGKSTAQFKVLKAKAKL